MRDLSGSCQRFSRLARLSRVEVFGVLKPAGILLEALTTVTKINCEQGLISNCLNPADMVVRILLYFLLFLLFLKKCRNSIWKQLTKSLFVVCPTANLTH